MSTTVYLLFLLVGGAPEANWRSFHQHQSSRSHTKHNEVVVVVVVVVVVIESVTFFCCFREVWKSPQKRRK
jgi:heme/copper-type cytochrome/quinol oxidase subunit 2